MFTMCREFAKCQGLTHMGLGMLIAGAFLHLVFAATNQFILPLVRLALPGAAAGKMAHMTKPHLTLEPWGFVHALVISSLVLVASYVFLKWSNRLARERVQRQPPVAQHDSDNG